MLPSSTTTTKRTGSDCRDNTPGVLVDAFYNMHTDVVSAVRTVQRKKMAVSELLNRGIAFPVLYMVSLTLNVMNSTPHTLYRCLSNRLIVTT